MCSFKARIQTNHIFFHYLGENNPGITVNHYYVFVIFVPWYAFLVPLLLQTAPLRLKFSLQNGMAKLKKDLTILSVNSCYTVSIYESPIFNFKVALDTFCSSSPKREFTEEEENESEPKPESDFGAGKIGPSPRWVGNRPEVGVPVQVRELRRAQGELHRERNSARRYFEIRWHGGLKDNWGGAQEAIA